MQILEEEEFLDLKVPDQPAYRAVTLEYDQRNNLYWVLKHTWIRGHIRHTVIDQYRLRKTGLREYRRLRDKWAKHYEVLPEDR